MAATRIILHVGEQRVPVKWCATHTWNRHGTWSSSKRFPIIQLLMYVLGKECGLRCFA